MKTLKCIVSVLLGAFLGLLASCVHRGTKTNPVTPDAKVSHDQAKTNAPPTKTENLPIRRPILE